MSASSMLTGFGWGSATYANDALLADQLDELVLNRASRVALGVGLEVAQVTDVTV